MERFTASAARQHHQGPASPRLEGSLHPVRRRPSYLGPKHLGPARKQLDVVEHAQPHVARSHLLRPHRHGS